VPALWGAASHSKRGLSIVYGAETAVSQSAMLLLEIGVHTYSYRDTESLWTCQRHARSFTPDSRSRSEPLRSTLTETP
jgi:hypothetical protein